MFAIAKKPNELAIATSAGMLAALAGWIYLHHLEGSFQEAGESAQVLVTSRYIPKGAVMRADLVQTAVLPKAYIQSGALSSFVVFESSPGHPRFRTAIPLLAGNQVLQSTLAPLSSGQGLSQEIPDDHVAVSFSVDNAHGVGGNIRPGDLINILHTAKDDSMKQTEHPERKTATLFQAVPVIAVGKKWKLEESEPADEKEKESKESSENEGEQTVLTVLLNPLTAVQLAKARENETLSVVLRGQGDNRIWENLP